VTTDYGNSLARTPRISLAADDFVVDAPATWIAEGSEVGDPDRNVTLLVIALPSLPADQLAAWEDEARGVAIARGFSSIEKASPRIALPAGWTGSEWIVGTRDALGSRQRFRMIAFVGEAGGAPLEGLMFAPDVLSWSGARGLAEILATVR